MARKTDAELQQRIQELKNNQEQAVQVANNCRDEIMRIEAVLVDRAEAETVKKVYCEIIEKQCKCCGKVFSTTEQRSKVLFKCL